MFLPSTEDTFRDLSLDALIEDISLAKEEAGEYIRGCSKDGSLYELCPAVIKIINLLL